MPGPVSEAAKLPDMRCDIRGCKYDAEHSYWKGNDWLQLCDKHDRLINNLRLSRGFLIGTTYSNSVKAYEQTTPDFAKVDVDIRLAAVFETMNNVLVMINEPLISKEEKDLFLKEIHRVAPAVSQVDAYKGLE